MFHLSIHGYCKRELVGIYVNNVREDNTNWIVI